MADVFVSLSGDASKLEREFQKINNKTKELDASLKQTKKSSDDTFGMQGLAQLSSYAAGFVSIHQALGVYKQMLTDIQAVGDQLAQQQRSNMAQTGPLAQLAFGDKNLMRQMIISGKASYGQGAGITQGEAQTLQFEIASATYDRYRKEIAALKASQAIPDPIGLVVGAAAFETRVGAAAGGFPNIANLTIGAAGKSPGQIPGIALGAAEAAGTGTYLGISPREMYGATATLSKAAGSPEEGGMLAKNLFKGIQAAVTRGVLKPGRTLQQYMADIAALEATGRSDISIVGADIREFSAYRALKSGIAQGQYAASLADIDRAVQTDQFTKLTEMYKVDPGMIGGITRQQTKAKLELTRENYGAWSNLAQSVQDDIARLTVQRGGSRSMQWADEKIQGFSRWMYGDPEYVRRFGWMASDDTRQAILDAAQAMREMRDAAIGAREAVRSRAAINVQPE